MKTQLFHIDPTQETPDTRETVGKLVRKGFKVNSVREFEGEKGLTIFMAKYGRGRTFYAQIDPDGRVNGETAENFLASL